MEDKSFQVGDSYKWEIFFFETNGHVGYHQEGVSTASPETEVPTSLPEMPSGVYSFELNVFKMRDGVPVDTQSWRSGAVHFDRTDLVVNNDNLEFHYGIAPWAVADAKPLSSVQIYAVNGNWTEGSVTSGPVALNPAPASDHVVTAPEATNDEPGEGRVIATGVDKEAERYRDHRNKQLWPLNQVGPLHYRRYLLEGPSLTGAVDMTGKVEFDKPYMRIQTPGGKAATINDIVFNTNVTPDVMWRQLASYKSAKGAGNQKWRPVLINTHAHSNIGIHIISTVKGGGGFSAYDVQHSPDPNGYPSWIIGEPPAVPHDVLVGEPQRRYTITQPHYSLSASSTPDLQGVTFFNMMGCLNSASSAGKHTPTAAGFRDIAQFVSTNKKAGNSVGYSTTTVFSAGGLQINRVEPGNIWAHMLYSKSVLAKSSAIFSFEQADYDYYQRLRSIGYNDSCTSPASSPNYGWDKWVITKPNVPILDR